MADGSNRLKYMLPTGENMLRTVQENILHNLKYGNEAKVALAPLVQRAYTIVNETGVVPYRDYAADLTFIKEN